MAYLEYGRCSIHAFVKQITFDYSRHTAEFASRFFKLMELIWSSVDIAFSDPLCRTSVTLMHQLHNVATVLESDQNIKVQIRIKIKVRNRIM